MDSSSESALTARPGLVLMPLDPKVQRVWVVNTILTAILLVPLVGLLEFGLLNRRISGWREPALTAGWALFSLSYGLAMIKRRFASWRYGLDEYAITIENGVWNHQRISIPRARIQHVEIHQGPWDRKFGIKQININTAGSQSISIPGLPPEEAERLREQLIFSAATTPKLPFTADASELLDP